MKKGYRKVAVIGRPNVGKSTLFNRLLSDRRSIVDDRPGVTRDRLYADIDWNGKGITLIDTGGIIYEDNEEINAGVRKQVYIAIEEADFILFMVDGKAGLTAVDERIAQELRKRNDGKKVFLAVNKVDTEKQIHYTFDFHSLGLGEPYPISALQGSEGLANILDHIANDSVTPVSDTEDCLKIAIVGKPNVGKSSLLNALNRKERSIVTSIAGTTRDSIDTRLTVNQKDYLLIDTAGLRRKSKVDTKIESYANSRTISAIERADVILFLVQANEHISDQDQKIAALIKRKEKPSIVLVNKWDLVEERSSSTMNEIEEKILRSLKFIDYSKVLFISATEKKNLSKIWNLVEEVYENAKRRYPTSKLNKACEDIILRNPPPVNRAGKRLKLYYVTQASVLPPEIVFFVNDSKLVKTHYERYLERELRVMFDFSGTPIRLVFRNKSDE